MPWNGWTCAAYLLALVVLAVVVVPLLWLAVKGRAK